MESDPSDVSPLDSADSPVKEDGVAIADDSPTSDDSVGSAGIDVLSRWLPTADEGRRSMTCFEVTEGAGAIGAGIFADGDGAGRT